MHHGGCDKMQDVCSKRQRVTVRDDCAVFREILSEKLMHHGKCLCCRHNGGIGIILLKNSYACRMIGLHMLNHQIIRLSAFENRFQIIKPLVRKSCIYGIHHSNLFVCDNIGIIGHTAWHRILTFKKIDSMIVYSDVVNIFGYHTCFLRHSVSMLNSSLPTPQRGQTKSSGILSHAVPGAISSSGQPISSSYTKPQILQIYLIVFPAFHKFIQADISPRSAVYSLFRYKTLFSPEADSFTPSAPVFVPPAHQCPVSLHFSKKTVVGRFPEIHDAAADLFPDRGSYQDRKYSFPQYRGKNHSKHRPPVWVFRSVHNVRKPSSYPFPPLILLQSLTVGNNTHLCGFLFTHSHGCFFQLVFLFRQRQASVSAVSVEPDNERIPAPEGDESLYFGIPDTLPQKSDDAE